MITISQALDALTERQAEHRKVCAGLAEMRQTHTRSGERLTSLRAQFAGVANDPAKGEKIATKIGAVERVTHEQKMLIAGHVARERAAQGMVHAAERKIAQLRERRRDLEQILIRTAGDRAKLVHRAEQAERMAEQRRELVAEHDRAVRHLAAEFAGLAEPELAA